MKKETVASLEKAQETRIYKLASYARYLRAIANYRKLDPKKAFISATSAFLTPVASAFGNWTGWFDSKKSQEYTTQISTLLAFCVDPPAFISMYLAGKIFERVEAEIADKLNIENANIRAITYFLSAELGGLAGSKFASAWKHEIFLQDLATKEIPFLSDGDKTVAYIKIENEKLILSGDLVNFALDSCNKNPALTPEMETAVITAVSKFYGIKDPDVTVKFTGNSIELSGKTTIEIKNSIASVEVEKIKEQLGKVPADIDLAPGAFDASNKIFQEKTDRENEEKNRVTEAEMAALLIFAESLIMQHKETLKNEFSRKEALLNKAVMEANNNNADLHQKIIICNEEIIKFKIFLLLTKEKVKALKGKIIKPMTTNDFKAIIENEAESLFRKAIRDQTTGCQVITEYLKNLYPNQALDVDELTPLNEIFEEHHQLITGEMKMKNLPVDNITETGDLNMKIVSTNNTPENGTIETFKNMSLKDAKEIFFRCIEGGNYTQCGLLMKSGVLGQKQFIAGLLIEGILDCQKLSHEADMHTKAMLCSLLSQTQANERAFDNEVTELQKKYADTYAAATKEVGLLFKDAKEFLHKAYFEGDSSSREAANKYMDSVSAATQQILEKAPKVDHSFVLECKKMSKEIVLAMTDAVNKCTEKRAEGFAAFMSTVKEMYLAGKNNKNDRALPAADDNTSSSSSQNSTSQDALSDFRDGLKAYSAGEAAFERKDYKLASEKFCEAKNYYAFFVDSNKTHEKVRNVQKHLATFESGGRYSPSKFQ